MVKIQVICINQAFTEQLDNKNIKAPIYLVSDFRWDMAKEDFYHWFDGLNLFQYLAYLLARSDQSRKFSGLLLLYKEFQLTNALYCRVIYNSRVYCVVIKLLMIWWQPSATWNNIFIVLIDKQKRVMLSCKICNRCAESSRVRIHEQSFAIKGPSISNPQNLTTVKQNLWLHDDWLMT